MSEFQEWRLRFENEFRFAFYSPKHDDIALVGHYMEYSNGDIYYCYKEKDPGAQDRPYHSRKMKKYIFERRFPIYLGDLDAKHIELKELDHLK